MKTLKYRCVSRSTPNTIGKGETPVIAVNLYLASIQLNSIRELHIRKGDTIVYKNRHSMKVEVQDENSD